MHVSILENGFVLILTNYLMIGRMLDKNGESWENRQRNSYAKLYWCCEVVEMPLKKGLLM